MYVSIYINHVDRCMKQPRLEWRTLFASVTILAESSCMLKFVCARFFMYICVLALHYCEQEDTQGLCVGLSGHKAHMHNACKYVLTRAYELFGPYPPPYYHNIHCTCLCRPRH
jgi:hypothetical protein